jgi:hypothetical protein
MRLANLIKKRRAPEEQLTNIIIVMSLSEASNYCATDFSN